MKSRYYFHTNVDRIKLLVLAKLASENSGRHFQMFTVRRGEANIQALPFIFAFLITIHDRLAFDGLILLVSPN